MARGPEIPSRALRNCLSPRTLVLLNWKSIQKEGGSFGVLKPELLVNLAELVEQTAHYMAQEGRSLDFIERVSLAVYLLVKGHPFQDGNKRTALRMLINCLRLAELKYTGRPIDLAYSIEAIAKSDPSEKEKLFLEFAGFLKRHLQRRDKVA
ncbi:Fic family protein [Thermosulfurimonas dismutans]